jgi:hypothetical protein
MKRKYIMQGTIRILAGLLLVMGGVGGMETESATLLEGVLTSVLGLTIMGWGVSAANRQGS